VIVAERPSATLAEIAAEVKRRVGIDAHAATIRKTLREAGIGRVRGEERAQRVERPARECRGYSEAHRRWEPDQRYPSCLTDAEWALVEDLFEREGGQGRPPRVSRRALVDACGYVVRTGCGASARDGRRRPAPRCSTRNPRAAPRKAGRAASTLARRLRAASAVWWSTPSACCWR